MSDRSFLRWYPACILAAAAVAVGPVWWGGDDGRPASAPVRAAKAHPLEPVAGAADPDDPAVVALQAAAARRRERVAKARAEWRRVLAASSRTRLVPPWPGASGAAGFAGCGRPRTPRPPGAGPLDTRGVCVLPGPERVVCGWLAANMAVGPCTRGAIVAAAPALKGGPFGPEVRWLQAQLQDPALTADRIATLQLRLADAQARQRRFPHHPR